MKQETKGPWPSGDLERVLTDLYRERAPEGFERAWRAAVKREERLPMKQTGPRFWKMALPMAAVLVLLVGTWLTGTSPLGVPKPGTMQKAMPQSQANLQRAGTMDEAEDGGYFLMEDAPSGVGPAGNAASMGGGAGGVAEPMQGKKLVRTAEMALATGRFDEAVQTVRDQVSSVGGYVQSVYQYEDASKAEQGAERAERRINFSLRIPTDQLDGFLSGMAGVGRVTYRSETSVDKTVEYTDTGLALQTQKDKWARLQELLSKAENVADLLQIETEMANTQYAIDSYETRLRTIDKDVDQSLVTVTLEEETPAQTAAVEAMGLGDRLGNGLQASVQGIGRFFQNLLVFLVMALPVALPVALLGLGAWWLLRRHKKNKGPEKKEEIGS